jgi:predicted transcriptional regulator
MQFDDGCYRLSVCGFKFSDLLWNIRILNSLLNSSTPAQLQFQELVKFVALDDGNAEADFLKERLADLAGQGLIALRKAQESDSSEYHITEAGKSFASRKYIPNCGATSGFEVASSPRPPEIVLPGLFHQRPGFFS